ncbi:MAG: disulfide bond formation protein B [Parcubacteria group bacterium]
MTLSTRSSERLATYTLYLAWLITIVGTAGSLYFSEIRGLIPCVLCWYQRMALYPIAVILLVELLRKDRVAVWYALPFSIVGIALAAWHVALQEQVVFGSLVPCEALISCAEKQIEFFGWITIPILSLTGFVAITALLIAHVLLRRKNLRQDWPAASRLVI